MPKFIYSIGSTSSDEAVGELEIEARDAYEAFQKAKAAEKSGKYLKEGEHLYEWREVHEPPSGVKRRKC